MFKLEPEQIHAFRKMGRKKLSGNVLDSLHRQGLKAECDDSTGDVLCLDARGFQTRLSFYPDGLPARLTAPSGNELGFEHDAQGRLGALVYSGQERLDMKRDVRGNITELSRPGLFSYALRYDEGDRPLVIHCPDGSTTRFSWHPSGALESTTDRCGAMTRYERDEDGKLLSVIDPLGRRTQYVTSESGTLEAIVFPDGSRQEYASEQDAAIAALVLRGGGTVFHELEEGGDTVQAITWADGTRSEFELQGGNLVRAQNEMGLISSTFDDKGNPLTEESAAGKIQYAYDAEGRLVRLVTPWGDALEYEYDGDGRLCGVRDWEGRESRVAYALDGTVSEILYGNGLRELQQRARTGRVGRSRVESRSGRILSEQCYEYDLCERLTGLVDFRVDSTTPRSARGFLYDAEGRLLGELDRNGGRQVAHYGYDAKGNLVEDCGAAVRVGLLDEPLSHGDHSIEYDGDGNMVRLPARRGELRFTWGGEGLLRQLDCNGLVMRFAYDALGRRILKTNGRTIWRYGWAGQQLLWEEVERYPGAKPIRRDYLFLPDTVIPLAFREEGRTYWLQSDARGAIIRAFDEAGQVVWNSSYDSFGTARVELELVRQPWRLAGQYEDEETGLHYNLARYYCPWLKSYLSRDPRWYEPEATGYSYCRNDPWNRADPFGGLAPLLAVGIAGLVGAAVGAITAAAMGGDPIAGAVGGAIAGAGSIIAVVAGASAGVVLAAGVVATGVGALAESLVEQANSGDGFCLQCALASAAAAALTDLALFGLGKIPGVRRLAQVVAKRLSHFGAQAKKWGGKLFSSLLLRLVRTRARPPFSKPWSQMTNAERKAFQHAYSRHGADFNLPNWSQSKAEQLRQQFNQAVEGVRDRAQSAFITKKPFGVKGSGKTGDSKYMIFLRHSDGGGTTYYYCETLMGRFVSSGLNRP